MDYKEIEFKIAQYVQWCGNPLAALGYGGCSISWRHVPRSLNPDALPQLSEAEAHNISLALVALKQCNRKAYDAIYARFWRNWSDAEIGRKLRLGGKDTVFQLRMRGYSALQMYFHRRDLSASLQTRTIKRRPNPRQQELEFS